MKQKLYTYFVSDIVRTLPRKRGIQKKPLSSESKITLKVLSVVPIKRQIACQDNQNTWKRRTADKVVITMFSWQVNCYFPLTTCVSGSREHDAHAHTHTEAASWRWPVPADRRDMTAISPPCDISAKVRYPISKSAFLLLPKAAGLFNVISSRTLLYVTPQVLHFDQEYRNKSWDNKLI
jgi:hypothetical protein